MEPRSQDTFTSVYGPQFLSTSFRLQPCISVDISPPRYLFIACANELKTSLSAFAAETLWWSCVMSTAAAFSDQAAQTNYPTDCLSQTIIVQTLYGKINFELINDKVNRILCKKQTSLTSLYNCSLLFFALGT